MDVSHLVEQELGILGVMLGGEGVRMVSLEIQVDRIQKVLVKDHILRGELISF